MHGWSWSAQHPVPGPPPQPAAGEFEVILNFFPAFADVKYFVRKR